MSSKSKKWLNQELDKAERAFLDETKIGWSSNPDYLPRARGSTLDLPIEDIIESIKLHMFGDTERQRYATELSGDEYFSRVWGGVENYKETEKYFTQFEDPAHILSDCALANINGKEPATQVDVNLATEIIRDGVATLITHISRIRDVLETQKDGVNTAIDLYQQFDPNSGTDVGDFIECDDNYAQNIINQIEVKIQERLGYIDPLTKHYIEDAIINNSVTTKNIEVVAESGGVVNHLTAIANNFQTNIDGCESILKLTGTFKRKTARLCDQSLGQRLGS